MTTRSSLAALLVVSAVTIGCNREEPEAPVAQSQAQSAQTLNTPATLTGCLSAGEAGGTYVLNASQSADGTTPATYQLAAASGVNLEEHVGNRVEITGVINDQQHVATTEAPRPADGDRATGTSGTPSVQSTTQLAVRRMDVNSIRRAEGSCE